MKPLKIAGLTLGAVLLALNARAQNLAGTWYANADLGVSFLEDVTGKSLTSGNQTINLSGGTAQFETGIRGGVAGGYHLDNDWSFEVESAIIWNSVNKLGGTSLGGTGASIDLYQIPVIFSARYKVPLQGSWTARIGAGVGAVASMVDVSTIANAPLGIPAANGSAWDFTFAFQGTADFKYAISPRADIGVTYKFLGSMDHDWSDQGVTLKTEGIYSHAILASFSWKF